MTETFDILIQWLYLHPHWGGFVTFIISALESIAIVGTLVPGSIMMSGIGALMGTGILPFWTTLAWAIAGAIAGDGISFALGYYFKGRISGMWPFKTRPHMLDAGKTFFAKHGGVSVFLGRFVGPVRAVVPLIAGMMHMSKQRFYIANIASGFLWAPAYMLPGFILGAISLQLPTHLAIRYIAIFLSFCLMLILLTWGIKRFYHHVDTQLSAYLTKTRDKWAQSKHKHWLAKLVEHPDPKKQNLQFARLISLCIVAFLFLILATNVAVLGVHISLNTSTYQFFRNFHTPYLTDIAIIITYLADTHVLAGVIAITAIYFFAIGQTRLALYWLTYCVIVLASILCIKFLIHTPRPAGIAIIREGTSFPSGHVTRIVAMLGFLITRLIRSFHKDCYKPLLRTFVTIVILVMISRVYLLAHWLTDITGGLLLGLLLLIAGNLIYERLPEKKIKPKTSLLIIIASFSLFTSIYTGINFTKNKRNSQLVWPNVTMMANTWWNQHTSITPHFSANAFGIKKKSLNIQWAGSLANISKQLLEAHWQQTPRIGWLKVLHPIDFVNAMQHSPFLQHKLDGKIPALVFSKTNSNNDTLILYLWNSHIQLDPEKIPLWVGRIDYLRKQYDNAQTRNADSCIQRLASELSAYTTKPVSFYDKKSGAESYLLLIKPKG